MIEDNSEWQPINQTDRNRFAHYSSYFRDGSAFDVTKRTVLFEKPFSKPPQVIMAVKSGHNKSGDVPIGNAFSIILNVDTVTVSNFTFTAVQSHGNGRTSFEWLEAAWTAAAQLHLSDAFTGEASARLLPRLFGVTREQVLSATTAPTVLQPLNFLPDGGFSLNFEKAIPGREYGIEASTNLQDWFFYRSFTATDFSVRLTNPPAGFDRLFLRSRGE